MHALRSHFGDRRLLVLLPANKNISSDCRLSAFCFPELKLNFQRFQFMKTCQPVSYTRNMIKCRRFDSKFGVRDARIKLKKFVKV